MSTTTVEVIQITTNLIPNIIWMSVIALLLVRLGLRAMEDDRKI